MPRVQIPDSGAPARIQKILSAHGIASRRQAEQLILAGRVTVNGKPAVIGQSAQFGYDEIAVDCVPLMPVGELVYIMLNKPRGYITTVSDDRGRQTVMDLVTGVGTRVFPVGRLDMDTEGLLLLTNDGHFANAVAHPSNGLMKTYEVRIRGETVGAAKMLCRPMEIDSHIVHAASAVLTERTENGAVLHVTISEGRNRQIRKMCAKCGFEVLSLMRLSIGPLGLGSLETGKWRRLTKKELRSLCDI